MSRIIVRILLVLGLVATASVATVTQEVATDAKPAGAALIATYRWNVLSPSYIHHVAVDAHEGYSILQVLKYDYNGNLINAHEIDAVLPAWVCIQPKQIAGNGGGFLDVEPMIGQSGGHCDIPVSADCGGNGSAGQVKAIYNGFYGKSGASQFAPFCPTGGPHGSYAAAPGVSLWYFNDPNCGAHNYGWANVCSNQSFFQFDT